METYIAHFMDAMNALNNEDIAKAIVDHLGSADAGRIADYLEQQIQIEKDK